LSSRQFAAACRKAGFRGNLRALWGHICESDGFLERSYVNLRIFYPRGFEEVQGFRRICETQFACASEVYFYLLERASRGSVNKPEFIDAVANLMIEGDLEQIFYSLMIDEDLTAELDLEDIEDLRIGDREAWKESEDEEDESEDESDGSTYSPGAGLEDAELRNTVAMEIKTTKSVTKADSTGTTLTVADLKTQ